MFDLAKKKSNNLGSPSPKPTKLENVPDATAEIAALESAAKEEAEAERREAQRRDDERLLKFIKTTVSQGCGCF